MLIVEGIALFFAKGTNVLCRVPMLSPGGDDLTNAQNELYRWIKVKRLSAQSFHKTNDASNGTKSPAPIQSRLKHLQEKGYISWQEGKARTMKIVEEA